MKNKKLTLHIRIDSDLLDALSLKYQADLEAHYSRLSFSEYIRKILRVHVTR